MKHLAYKYSFDQLFAGINQQVVTGYVTRRDNGNLALFDYNNHCQFSRYWNDFTLMSRGIILDLEKKCVVALPMPKFFNLGEDGFRLDQLPDHPYTVWPKVDGSCIIVYHYGGKWRCSTRGSFDSEQALWAQEILDNNNTNRFDENLTYVFELIHPRNQIVVKYDGLTCLMLLTAFNRNTFMEQPYNEISYIAIFNDKIQIIEGVQTFKSPQDIVEYCGTSKKNEEGFVIQYHNGIRVKVKTEKYKQIHRTISDFSNKSIWENILNGNSKQEILYSLPDEFLVEFNTYWDKMVNQRDIEYNNVINAFNNIKHLKTRKEFALEARSSYPHMMALLFMLLDNYSHDEIKRQILLGLKPENYEKFGRF